MAKNRPAEPWKLFFGYRLNFSHRPCWIKPHGKFLAKKNFLKTDILETKLKKKFLDVHSEFSSHRCVENMLQKYPHLESFSCWQNCVSVHVIGHMHYAINSLNASHDFFFFP